MRKKISLPKDLCYHISHRCYDNCKMLRFANGRNRFVKRLLEMKNKYRVKVLNWVLTTSSYRLLLVARSTKRISEALKYLHGTASQDYAKARNTEGPFWKGRYNITMIAGKVEVTRCSLDMDFEILKNDPTIYHPLLWKYSGHQEICDKRQSYRVTDRKAQMQYFPVPSWEVFRELYVLSTHYKWEQKDYQPEPWWEEALFIGSKTQCEEIAGIIREPLRELLAFPPLQSIPEFNSNMLWTVITSRKYKRRFILQLGK